MRKMGRLGAGFLIAAVLGLPALLRAMPGPQGEDDDAVIERQRWFYGRRHLGIPKGHRAAELRQAAKRQALAMPMATAGGRTGAGLSAASASPGGPGSWVAQGPMPLIGVYSGRGSCLALDLGNDPSGNTVYYGSAYGGVWKTSNGLSASPTFAPISDPNQSQAVGAIALDSSVSPPIIYVGSGEADASAESYYGVGIFKSTNDGASWSLASSADNGAHSFLGLSFSKIQVDPVNHSVLLAAAVFGSGINGAVDNVNFTAMALYRSTDAGQTWIGVPAMAGRVIWDIEYDATRAAYIASVDGQGYFRSTD
ncbi:MAG TPA: hypothetical protein VNZ67_08640, partial [bacterium]|nr:hypothetical protein [bacterium]